MADPSAGEPPQHVAYNFTVLRVRTGTSLRLIVKGEVDIATAPRLHEQIERLWAGDAELVILDLERVTFFDSTGLSVLVRAHEHLDGRRHESSGGGEHPACRRRGAAASLPPY